MKLFPDSSFVEMITNSDSSLMLAGRWSGGYEVGETLLYRGHKERDEYYRKSNSQSIRFSNYRNFPSRTLQCFSPHLCFLINRKPLILINSRHQIVIRQPLQILPSATHGKLIRMFYTKSSNTRVPLAALNGIICSGITHVDTLEF